MDNIFCVNRHIQNMISTCSRHKQSLMRKLIFFYLFYIFKVSTYLTLRAHFKGSLGTRSHWLPCGLHCESWCREPVCVGYLQPEGQVQSVACFINKVFLEHAHVHSVICCLWLFSCRCEKVQQRQCGQQSLKHLLFCPFQKKSADLCSRRSFFSFSFFFLSSSLYSLSLKAFANVLILHSSALGSQQWPGQPPN